MAANPQTDSKTRVQLEQRFGKPDRYDEYNRRIPCPRCGSRDTHAHVGLNLFRCFDCDRWSTLL